ncbi:OLC1v1007761C2 [Oldenlandia corymbosa var. corymbosa]|uniref:OLC1v1007761C2 n=1 Tax=Oldenlandia corymbosa var. corymbosa TaxID=529605 RepID=A0AAV1DJZ9_OLDCO|nr:OLC1v1007761C2 [Oldenlandia corymbosa var. corymbosa]
MKLFMELLNIIMKGNGDDNFLLALSVDKVSQNEGIKFVLGEKEAEVTPCCIVLCVTVDGKLSLFHFASAASAASSRLDLADADTQVDKHLNVLSEQSRSGIFREVIEPRAVSLTSEDGKSSGNDNDKPEEQGVSTNQAQKSSVSSQMLKSDNEGMFSFTNLEENRGTQESEVAEKLSLKSEYSPFHTSHPEVPGTEARNVGKTIMSAPFEAKLHADSLSEMVLNDASRSVSKSMQTSSVFGFGGGISVSDSSVRRFLLPGDSDGKSASPAYIVPSLQSEKSKLQPAGAISLSPKDMKETSNQSFRMISQGERAATMAESRSTSPSTFDLQVPSREKFVSGKSSMPRLGVENFRTSSHLLQSNHEQKQSSQFSNVEMLVKQMDEILEHIGGDGGFKDASITFQEGSVSALEEGIRLLSDRCRTWRGKLEAQSRDIEHLLDKTVQVLARKVYMEGIFQQATDNWYSDLWNSHKLNLELELKRQHILEIDHELASQLVQLERHFNTIELNKFGESGALQENQKIVESGFGKPRELRTLQDTMLAQLAAAEKLSERLKKQMAALSIECRDSKQNIKREVFETLGLAYDGASYNILCKEKAPDTPRKDLLAKFSSVTAKDHCWKNLSTTTKNSEPKTVRRRRDSLGQMKSSVIPLKTTVKRALLLEDHGSLESRFPTEVKELRPELQLGEEIVHPVHSGPNDVYVRSLFQYEGKASGRTALKKFAQHPSMLSPWTSGPADPGIEVVPARSSPAFVEPPPDTASARQNVAWENHTLSGKYTSNLAFGQTSGNDSRHVQQFPKFPSDGPLVAERNSAVSPVPFKNSIENPIFRNEERGTSGATNRKVEPTTIRSERSLAVSPPISLGKVLDTETSANHLGEKISSATNRVVQSTASTSFPEPSGEIKSHSTSSGHSLSISPAILDEKSLQSHSLFSSVSINSFSSGTPSSGDKGAESQESGSQPLLGVFTSNKDERLVLQTTKTTLLGGETAKAGEASVLQPELSTGSSRFIIASEASTASPATKFPGSLNSESQLNIESASSPPVSEMAPNSMIGRALPSKDDLSASPAAIFTGVSLDGKDATSVNNEDEMEEEAPESNLTTELSLGDLGGLGFGSSSTLTVTKPNPFGVETVGPVSSQFQMPSPQGGMFRPASFNFQSPLPLQPSVASTSTLFSSGFSSGGGNLGHSSGGFGQPAQFGQQSLGSVLGAFGQSRQLGASPPGNSSAPSSGFGGSFTGSPSAGFGFAAATTPGGGFAAAATSGGGFAAAAASGGGFANVANPGGGGGGFAGAATAGGGFAAAATAGGGFGAFSNQFGGNFSAFGSSSGAGRPPSDLFTQMRK